MNGRAHPELTEQYDIHPVQITDWKIQLAEIAGLVFAKGKRPESGGEEDAIKARAHKDPPRSRSHSGASQRPGRCVPGRATADGYPIRQNQDPASRRDDAALWRGRWGLIRGRTRIKPSWIPPIARRLLGFLRDRLATLDDPRSIGEALKGSKLGAFLKYRVGDYRIIASIEDEKVRMLVVRIGNRRAVYKR